jgi:hypothetical protein|tara:strand:- start:749 stop:1267 length:519 start_codon:yes stop_codon:yes gene_type:complete
MAENTGNIEMAEAYEKSGVDMFDAPTPGSSLTSDPQNPRAWESPPEFNTEEEALKNIFMNLTDEDNHEQLLNSLRDGESIEMIVQIILFKGFQEGKWSPDLMLLLIEPTIVIVMWLADKAGIDATLDSDGDNWEEEDEMMADMQKDTQRMKPNNNLPQSLLSQMGEFSGETV